MEKSVTGDQRPMNLASKSDTVPMRFPKFPSGGFHHAGRAAQASSWNEEGDMCLTGNLKRIIHGEHSARCRTHETFVRMGSISQLIAFSSPLARVGGAREYLSDK